MAQTVEAATIAAVAVVKAVIMAAFKAVAADFRLTVKLTATEIAKLGRS